MARMNCKMLKHKTLKKTYDIVFKTILFGICFPSITLSATLTHDGKYSISGISAQRITNFTGSGNGVNVDLGSGIVPSG